MEKVLSLTVNLPITKDTESIFAPFQNVCL
jgi:hypothetical protein